MALTLTEKILSSHLKTGTLERGNPIGISIDQTHGRSFPVKRISIILGQIK